MTLASLRFLMLFIFCAGSALAATDTRDILKWEPCDRFLAEVRKVVPLAQTSEGRTGSDREWAIRNLHLEIERVERLVAVARGRTVITEREYERGRASPERVKACRLDLDGIAKYASELVVSVVREGYGDQRVLNEARDAFLKAISDEKDRLARYES